MTLRSAIATACFAALLGGCAGAPNGNDGAAPALASQAEPVGLWRVTDDCLHAYAEVVKSYSELKPTDQQIHDMLDAVRAQKVRLYPDHRFVYQPDGAGNIRGRWSAEGAAVRVKLEPDALNVVTKQSGGAMRLDMIEGRLVLNVGSPGPVPSFDFTFERADPNPDAQSVRPVAVASLNAQSLRGVWVPDEPAMRAATGSRISKDDEPAQRVFQMQLLAFRIAFDADGTYLVMGRRGAWALSGNDVALQPPAAMTFTFKDGRLRAGDVILMKVETR
jgi:hypothetical protein